MCIIKMTLCYSQLVAEGQGRDKSISLTVRVTQTFHVGQLAFWTTACARSAG